MSGLRIDIWSDITCPWCYVGKRRLEAALLRFVHNEHVEITWRAFELDPTLPRQIRAVSYPERLARKYGCSVQRAERMIAQMTDVARENGICFDFARIRPGNTFDAHRVLHLARERGVQGAVKERFLRAYMTEGEAIGEPEVLVRLAGEAGLQSEEVSAVLAGDAHSRDVRADEAEASELGIHGVPFFLIDGHYAVSGAQPAELLLRGLDQAWSELQSQPPVPAAGPVCGPEGSDRSP